MKVGFKTGPRTWEEGKKIIAEDKPDFCEVWFRIDKAHEYDAMLDHLQSHNVRIGLHHWGLAAGQYKTNLATNREIVRQETIAQIKDTIDVSAKIDGAYVNVHPGAAQLEIFDLDSGRQKPAHDAVTSPEESSALFWQAVEELQSFAEKMKVLLTFETLPGRESYFFNDRSRGYDAGSIPLAVLGELGAKGAWLANDLTHTLAMLSIVETEEIERWNMFMAFTEGAAPFTRLLHANTLTAPYNGTDSHDGLTDQDFAKGVRPTREQMRSVLRLFKDRADVFVIPEPRSEMQSNWRALRALVESI